MLLGKRFLFLMFLSLFLCSSSFADTRTAGSCSEVDIQAAYDLAVDGDTISVPAGTCTWNTSTTGITFTKAVSIVGAGSGNDGTIIVDGNYVTDTSRQIFVLSPPSGKHITLTGFQFRDSDGMGQSRGPVFITGSGTFRVHDVYFYNLHARNLAVSGNSVSGVIDNCTMYKSENYSGNGAIVYGGKTQAAADYNWDYATQDFGSSRAVYFENNTITNTVNPHDGYDCDDGGRVVYRYNKVTNAKIFTHGYDSVFRSCNLMEVYNNTLIGTPGIADFSIQYRGGMGVVYNNALTGTWSVSGLVLTNYRSCSGYASGKGFCDGNPADDSATYPDENSEPTETYRGWLCRDQVGAGNPSQTETPLYYNNNTLNGSPLSLNIRDSYGGTCYTSTHIASGRDYIEGNKPGYSAYTCPHPLVGGSSCSDVAGLSGYNTTASVPTPSHDFEIHIHRD